VTHFAVIDAVGAEEGARNSVIAREAGESDMGDSLTARSQEMQLVRAGLASTIGTGWGSVDGNARDVWCTRGRRWN
jgi:hypothetical protein